MAIECRWEQLRLDQVVFEDASQALIEGEIIVPDVNAPIARILDIDCKAFINSCEVIQDQLMVEGILNYCTLYVPGGDEDIRDSIEALEQEIGFTQYIDMPGVRPRMTAQLNLDVEHTDYDLTTGRRLNVKSVLNLTGKVSQVTEIETVQDFYNVDDVELLTEKIHSTSTTGEGHSQTMLREDLELTDSMPSIKKLLRKDAKVKINEKKAADNRVIVHGDLHIHLLYLCEDVEHPIHYVDHEMPFSHFVDIEGAYQGMDCTTDVYVTEFYADVREDINGEPRIIDTEIILGLDARVLEPNETDIVIDAYSPTIPMDLETKEIKLKQFVGEGQNQTTIKENVTFPGGVPRAKGIISVNAKPFITDERVDDGQVTIEGILTVQVFYQTEDKDLLVSSFKQDIPFSHTLDIDGADREMECLSEVSEENVSSILLSQELIEVKFNILLKTSVYKTAVKSVVVGASESEVKEGPDSGIYIYFVQPGDNLWSVAKKYNTTISTVLRYNQLVDEGKLEPGTKLVIFKRIDTSVV